MPKLSARAITKRVDDTIKHDQDNKTIVETAITVAGSAAKLSRILDVTKTTIRNWKNGSNISAKYKVMMIEIINDPTRYSKGYVLPILKDSGSEGRYELGSSSIMADVEDIMAR